MSKKYLLLFVAALVVVIGLQNCKQDPAYEIKGEEPDSLYVGTPYTITPPLRGFPTIKVPEGNPLTEEGVRLGRMLFYDPVLSSDSNFSCASCHKQEFAFADGGKAFSQNIFGQTKRNTPPLFNMVWMKDFFWDGRVSTLPAQASDALVHEMNFISNQAANRLKAKPTYVGLFKKAFGRPGDINEEKISKALAQFMLTLISSESKYDSVRRGQVFFNPSELRGFNNLFRQDTALHGGDCFHCHNNNSSPDDLSLIDNLFHNNGLDSAASFDDFPDRGLGGFNGNRLDNGKFKTPHLRNVEVTGPYMRDGRFATLEQVVEFYNSGLTHSPTIDPFMKTVNRGGLRYLSEQDKEDLVAFLKTLTDHRFLTDTAFSNPFH